MSAGSAKNTKNTSKGGLSKISFEENKLEYEKMRQRLLETEEKLQNLCRLEEEVQSVASETTDRLSSIGLGDQNYARRYLLASHRDDVESLPSAISTVPGSYTGFIDHHHKVSSSTPNKKQTKRGSKAQEEDFESDGSSSSHNHKQIDRYGHKLLRQNQRLLLEVEHLVGELHTAKVENAKLYQVAERVKIVEDLEDKIEGLKAESQAQDKALREAENHIDESCKRNTELEKKLENCQAEIADLKVEIEEHKLTKKLIEDQRDEAVQSNLEVQESWEDYQRKMKEKFKKMEETEDALRDKISGVSHERNSLLDQLAELQTTVASQEAQIDRLINDVELEEAKQQQAEFEATELRDQLDQLTAQISDQEAKLSKVKEADAKKKKMEMELETYRQMLREASEIIQMVHHTRNTNSENDSGNVSTLSSLGRAEAFTSEASARLNLNNNGKEGSSATLSGNDDNILTVDVSTMSELRNLFYNMEAEINRLKANLRQKASDERTYQTMREEVHTLMEKVESGMRRNEELENLLESLEEEKMAVVAELSEAEQKLYEKDQQVENLDSRLSERNQQIIDLQEDISKRAQQVQSLEKKIREQTSRLSELTEKLENGNVLNVAQERIKELEQHLIQKEKAIAELQAKTTEAQKNMRTAQQTSDKKINLLSEQNLEYVKVVESLQGTITQHQQENSTSKKKIIELEATLRHREEMAEEMEGQIEDMKYCMSEKEKLHIKMLEGHQNELTQSTNQIHQLENALMLCKNEVGEHLANMEQIKAHYEQEMLDRDKSIAQLKQNLEKSNSEIKSSKEELSKLESSYSGLKLKLEQVCMQLKKSEQSEAALKEQVKQKESHIVQEKSHWLKESQDMEEKITELLKEYDKSTKEINRLKKVLQEKSNLVESLTDEKYNLCQELNSVKDKMCCVQDKLTKMEMDNEDLCRQLQQKAEDVSDLEKVINNKEEELLECTKCLEDLNSKVNVLKDGENAKERQQLRDQLQTCREELLNKNKLLSECEESYKCCSMDLRDKEEVIRKLNSQQEDLSSKLQERIVQVEELEAALETLDKEMEKRMKRVDEQLHRYEGDLTQKTRQITDLDECLKCCQHSLHEKTKELHQMEQKNNRLHSEYQSVKALLKETEERCSSSNRSLQEAKGENAEITQELRITREQLQHEHEELMATRGQLESANKEMDKMRQDIEETFTAAQERDSTVKALMEEKGALTGKISALERKLDTEIRVVKQKTQENEELQKRQEELENTNSRLVQKMSTAQSQLSQVEKSCHQKLDLLNGELEDLMSRLADRDEQLLAMKECLTLKESEIMRLKIYLCRVDQSYTNMASQIDLELSNKDQGHGPVRPNPVKAGQLMGKSRNKQGELLRSTQGSILSSDHDDDNEGLDGHSPDRERHIDVNLVPIKQDSDDDHECDGNGDRDSLGTRNSIGVSEVHERLRSNQLRQMEIERQLKSLEENAQEDI